MRPLENSLKKVLEKLGLERGYEISTVLKEFKTHLINTYGSEYIGKIRAFKNVVIVEVKSATLRQELALKKEELMEYLRTKTQGQFPEDIKFVRRL